MYKRYEGRGFEFDYVLGEYFLRIDGQRFHGSAERMTQILGQKLAEEPSGGRQGLMVKALASIVHPECSESGGKPSSACEVCETLSLGSLVQGKASKAQYRVAGLRRHFLVVEAQDNYKPYPLIEERFDVLLEPVVRGQACLVLELSTEHGMCGSGYTSAEWSTSVLYKVGTVPARDFGPFTHRPACEMRIEVGLDLALPGEFKCEAFGWSGDGGDSYYPRGGSWMEPKLWKETGRGFEKPVVHVFQGPSGTGKSTLGWLLRDKMSVYETDRDLEFYPEMVFAQVIILGGKWAHTLEQVRAFFEDKELDVELIPVSFDFNFVGE